MAYRIVQQFSDNFFPLMISHIYHFVFSEHSIAIIVESHLTGLSTNVARFDVMEYSST